MRTWRKNQQRGVRIADCCVCGLTIWSSQRSVVVASLPLKLRHSTPECSHQTDSNPVPFSHASGESV